MAAEWWQTLSVPKTFSESNIKGYRNWHAKADGYGRHRHLYLRQTISDLADEILRKKGGPATMLDYGCGKGDFIQEVRQLDMFGEVIGYDPAVDAHRSRPTGIYDIVTCLDVIDIVEPRFLDAVIDDVARFTGGVAIFDVLSKPPPESGFKPHPPYYWSLLVARRMRVIETKTEFPGKDGFERAVVKATPSR